MARQSTLYVVAAAALCSLAAAALSMSSFLDAGKSRPMPSVTDALNMPARLPAQLNLYAGGRDLDEGIPLGYWQSTFVVPRKDGHGEQARYNVGWDQSTEDVFFQADGEHMEHSQSYYPVRRGEEANGRHPHVERFYTAGTGALHDEDVRLFNGRRRQHTHIDDDGAKQITDYADYEGADVIVGQKSFDPKAVLKREERWRPDKQHSLSYSNILNEDGTRIATDWDVDHVPLKIAQWPQGGSAIGATVVAYFPDSHKLRLESKTDANTDSVNYYRDEDGTLACQVALSGSSAEITYFDNTGKKPRLKQLWYFKEENVNGVKQRNYYWLYEIGELDSEGNLTREVTFNDEGNVDGLSSYNAVANGTNYQMLYRSFRSDGTLDIVTYWPNGLHGEMEKREDHTAAENIRIPVAVPADELKRQVEIDPDLPLPPPQSSGH